MPSRPIDYALSRQGEPLGRTLCFGNRVAIPIVAPIHGLSTKELQHPFVRVSMVGGTEPHNLQGLPIIRVVPLDFIFVADYTRLGDDAMILSSVKQHTLRRPNQCSIQ